MGMPKRIRRYFPEIEILDLLISDSIHIFAELANLLVEAKADVNKQDFDGFTPLHWAVRSSGMTCFFSFPHL